jgi:hypothetical protein
MLQQTAENTFTGKKISYEMREKMIYEINLLLE